MVKIKYQNQTSTIAISPSRPEAVNFLSLLRIKSSKLKYWEAIAVIIGTIIGAGVLGIPYAFAKAGFWTSGIVLIGVGLVVLTTMLFMGELVVRTPAKHQLPGYIGTYLGHKTKLWQAGILIFSIYGALLAYTIGQGEVLSSFFGGDKLFWSMGFYLVFAYFVAKGLNLVKKFELVMVGFIILAIVALGIITGPSIDISNLAGLDLRNIFLPYGVIMFALYGLTAIPQAGQILGTQPTPSGAKKLRQAITAAAVIPIIFYLLFAVIVVGVTGQGTTEVGTIGLGEIMGVKVLLIGNLLAFFSMGTSFLALGLAVKQIYQDDLHLPKNLSIVLTFIIPPVAFWLGARDFIQVIGAIGAVGTGLTSILTILAFWQARRISKIKIKTALPNWIAYGVGGLALLMFGWGIISLFLS